MPALKSSNHKRKWVCFETSLLRIFVFILTHTPHTRGYINCYCMSCCMCIILSYSETMITDINQDLEGLQEKQHVLQESTTRIEELLMQMNKKSPTKSKMIVPQQLSVSSWIKCKYFCQLLNRLGFMKFMQRSLSMMVMMVIRGILLSSNYVTTILIFILMFYDCLVLMICQTEISIK